MVCDIDLGLDIPYRTCILSFNIMVASKNLQCVNALWRIASKWLDYVCSEGIVALPVIFFHFSRGLPWLSRFLSSKYAYLFVFFLSSRLLQLGSFNSTRNLVIDRRDVIIVSYSLVYACIKTSEGVFKFLMKTVLTGLNFVPNWDLRETARFNIFSCSYFLVFVSFFIETFFRTTFSPLLPFPYCIIPIASTRFLRFGLSLNILFSLIS